MQSNNQVLRILPSIFNGLGAGKIVDVATDFAARVSIDWDTRKGKCIVKIMPKISCKIDIEVCDTFRKVKGSGLTFDKDINGIKALSLVAGRAVTIEFA